MAGLFKLLTSALQFTIEVWRLRCLKLSDVGIGHAIVDDKIDSRLRLLGRSLADGLEALEGQFALSALPPGVSNAADIGKFTQLLIGIGIAVVDMT